MVKRIVRGFSSVSAWLGDKSAYLSLPALALVMTVVFGDNAMAADIPAMPIDFGSLATEAVVIVGTVLTAVAGIICIIALVRMGFRFLSRALTGSI